MKPDDDPSKTFYNADDDRSMRTIVKIESAPDLRSREFTSE